MKRTMLVMTAIGAFACGSGQTSTTTNASPSAAPAPSATDRPYLLEQVDDAAVVQVYADGFRDLA